MKPNTTDTPKLAPPGSGLPLIQRLALKLVIGPFVSKRVPPTKSRENYELLTRKIIEKVSKIPLELRSKKVLVSPIQGLEDSSRYWSLNGTLEHLLIVSKQMEPLILALASGVVPPGEANIAKVKPKDAPEDQFELFQAYAPGLMARLDQALLKPGMSLKSSAVFFHPWFGNLNAQQWYWLLASHQGIHYQQIKKIISGL